MERRNDMKRNIVLNNNNDEAVSPSTTKYETKINAFAVSEKDVKIWRRTLVRQPANTNKNTVQFKPTSKEQWHMVKTNKISQRLVDTHGASIRDIGNRDCTTRIAKPKYIGIRKKKNLTWPIFFPTINHH